jgi:hypothetical protein
MTATLDAAAGAPQQTIAELQRQLDECRAELAARNSEFGERIVHLPDMRALDVRLLECGP